MGDTFARQHPIDLAGIDHLVCSQTVTVLKLSFIKVGDGSKANMRVWTHINTLIRQEFRRASLIEKDERSHHLSLGRRQGPTYLEPTKVSCAGDDQRFNVLERGRVQRLGVLIWVPAHIDLLEFDHIRHFVCMALGIRFHKRA